MPTIVAARFPFGFWGSRRDRSAHDWPPSPSRLFSMLVQAHYKRALGIGEDATTGPFREALVWLENQPLPDVIYENASKNGPAYYSNHPETFVAKFPDQGNRIGRRRFFAVYPSKSNCLYYRWEDQDSKHWKYIFELLYHAAYFGTSRSVVRFTIFENELDSSGMVVLKADPLGDRHLDMYYPGRLEYLDSCEDNGEGYAMNKQANYKVERKEKITYCPSPWQRFVIFKLSGPPVHIKNASLVGARVRTACLSICGNSGPEVLIGHSPSLHCCFVPLSNSGGMYADGKIYGVGIAIPQTTPEVMHTCEEIFAKLEGFSSNEWSWQLEPAYETDLRTLMPETWGRNTGYYEWVSVTPVEVQHPKNNISSSEKRNFLCQEIVRHCNFMGLPNPELIELGPDLGRWPLPGFRGVADDAKLFRSHNVSAGRQSGRLVHCVLRFSVPVEGPLLLGRSKSFGSGIFRPYHWTVQRAAGRFNSDSLDLVT